jgi:glucose-1-phosphate thymidylyltransferase
MSKIKNGIILAGGTGSRLFPLTQVINKHLLGVNGKFIIDYPIDTLKQMGVENITIILGGAHFSQVVGYLQDGSRYGMNFSYVYQGEPKGIAHAISLCKMQVKNSSHFAVVLGDNIYENPIKWNYSNTPNNCQVVLHKHPELHRFGVASLINNEIINIEEKPKIINNDFDNYAITGCYLFDHQYFDIFNSIKPSPRGEYEITDIINNYNEFDELSWTKVDGLWSDAGTHESIAFVNNYFYNKSK